MGPIKEPKNVDFYVIDQPWTEKELTEFRELIKMRKEQVTKRKIRATKTKIRKAI